MAFQPRAIPQTAPEFAVRVAALPTNRWTKCLQCGAHIYNKRLEKNLKVCPECNVHFRLSARERLSFLLDSNSFQERDVDLLPGDPLRFRDSLPYTARIEESRRKSGEPEAAIYGTGTIGGYAVVVCAMEFTFMGGSMGSVVGEKVARAAELGISTKTPVLVCCASGGARMQEGAISLMQMAKTAAALARQAEAGVPFISLLADPTYGGVSASFGTLGDVIIAEPKAHIGFAGPQVIEQTIHQKLPEGFQTAEFLLEKGQIDLIVPRAELPLVLKKLLSYYANTREASAPSSSPTVAPATPRPESAQSRSAWECVQLARHADRPTCLSTLPLYSTALQNCTAIAAMVTIPPS